MQSEVLARHCAEAGLVEKGVGYWLEAGEVLARARHLCEQLGRQQQLGRVLLGQFQNRIARAELEQTERLADEILLLGDSRNDTKWKFFGSVSAGVTCGVFIKARAH